MLPEWRQQQIVDGARAVLSKLALAPNSIVIFDIDDTLITPTGKPYVPVIDLYNEALANGIHTGLITARSGDPSNVDATFAQLHRVGVADWSIAYFRSPKQLDVARFKRNARKDLWSKGYHVVMTVGDKEWDHGDYGGFSVLIR